MKVNIQICSNVSGPLISVYVELGSNYYTLQYQYIIK